MGRPFYALIDCASDPRIYYELDKALEYECLYAGYVDPVLAKAAPYLIAIEEGDRFWRFWMKEGFGKGWGIFCTSDAEFNDVRRHFRHFLRAKIPDGRIVEFRFYDPRVFRVYLPTCTPAELANWFKQVDSFVYEAPGAGTTDGTILMESKLAEDWGLVCVPGVFGRVMEL